MPTEPYKPLLDPDLAAVSAKELIDLAAPVLREVVNNSTWVYQRCQAATSALGGVDEDLAPFALYRHVIEVADGVEVLISKSCSLAAIPLVRSAFEASLGLEYLLKDDTARRGLAWLCAYSRQRIAYYELLDASTSRGGRFLAAWEKAFEFSLEPPAGQPEKALANLHSLFAEPHMAPVCAEFEVQKRAQNRDPNWYSLWGGPKHLSALASSLDREVEYMALYGKWSRFAHAGDLAPYLMRRPLGGTGVVSLRAPTELAQNVNLLVGFVLRCTRLMIDHYRKGENIQDWYLREVQEPWKKLAQARVKLTPIQDPSRGAG